MGSVKTIGGTVLVGVSFFLYLLALMKLFPLFIAAVLLYGSILFLITSPSTKKRFRGF